MFISKGTLRYSSNNNSKWWLVLDCCPDIIKYYRWLIEREDDIRINLPKYGSHISIIRGEKPEKNIDQWGFDNGEEIFFNVKDKYILDGIKKRIYCLSVFCNEITDLRSFFGLSTKYPAHLTIGWIEK